jgi:hypothetical protein
VDRGREDVSHEHAPKVSIPVSQVGLRLYGTAPTSSNATRRAKVAFRSTMSDVTVTKLGAGSFRVEVAAGDVTTTHAVSVPAGLAARLGGEGTSDEHLVEESFRYLLEREPNTSILRTFSIDQIGTYFPKWPSEIGKRLR